MGQLTEYIKMAIDNIRSNKGRSFLTMLGIIIGIFSVITIMAVGGGFQAQMNNDLMSFGGGQIFVYGSEEASLMGEMITREDLETLESTVEGVTGTTPSVSYTGITLTDKGEYDVSIVGGGNAQQEVSRYKVVEGRYFDESDIGTGNKVCVIPKKNALAVFGTTDVVGLTMDIDSNNMTMEVTIIGVVESENESQIISMGMGANDSISIDMPYTALESIGGDTEKLGSAYITSAEDADSKSVAKAVIDLLNSRHEAPESYFEVQDFNDQMGTINTMMGTITGFIAVVAAISLLVGGIGVMNIMLVSVTERTREIGIRKALGAKTSSILLQFLAESAIIASIGGIIGIILGVGLATLICTILGFQAAITAPTIIIATVFSSGIGVLFGVYPAKKAAKLSPIEALRRN